MRVAVSNHLVRDWSQNYQSASKFSVSMIASVLRRANVAKPLRISALAKSLRINALLTSQHTSCHDPSLARLSLLALPGLSSLRHLD